MILELIIFVQRVPQQDIPRIEKYRVTCCLNPDRLPGTVATIQFLNHRPMTLSIPTDNKEVSHLKMVYVMIQRVDMLMTLKYMHGKRINYNKSIHILFNVFKEFGLNVNI